VQGQNYKTLARQSLTLTEAKATLVAPESAGAGASIEVEWTGPDHKGDFITIVPKDTPEKKWAKYAYTRNGSPATVIAPMQVGPAEIRYLNGQGYDTLARIPITIEKLNGTLKAVETAVVGSAVSIEWTGPNNKGDFITIVTKDTPRKNGPSMPTRAWEVLSPWKLRWNRGKRKFAT
jgi:Ca-activated chloride channel family protein